MEKPQIEAQTGPVPDDLVIKDLIVGEGAEAQPGGVVEVHYVGVDFETGEEFDSSWDRGQTNQFPLTGLIAGWQEGIPGMKVGGRRQLTIPPEAAYGPEGSGVIFLGIGLDRPHNEYIQYALYLGIPGAALYLTALISLLVRCLGSLKRLPLEGLILGGMVFAYCISAFVGNSMYNTTIYFFCFLGMLAGIRARAR